MKTNKIKEFAKEHKMDILRGAGACVGCVVIYSVGYAVGYRDNARAVSKGIATMWRANPELQNSMWDALNEIENQRSRP